ncbi:hypothetical protein EDC04DRAFT_2642628 [Pisolithus marmoratus]|nr:hypothetical protein EDC04DRAFT_2642628 [Pisolithus marmoratus]
MHHRGLSPGFDAPLPKRRRTSDGATGVVAANQSLCSTYYASMLTGGVGVGVDANDVSTPSTLNEAYTEDLSGSLGQSLDLSSCRSEDHSEGDSLDHLQQPGNTKKRKVPVNMSANWLELPLRNLDFFVVPPISPSTLAGLQHKELLNHRKRQLATVLGALSLGDTLALDQALSTHIPFLRLSHRRGPRLARAAKAKVLSDASHETVFPTARFTFSYQSATSERLLATKREMLALRSRFEAELARQASKVAKAATQAEKAGIESTKASRSKRSDKAQQRPRTSPNDRSMELSNPPSLGKVERTYVPSRLAASASPNANLNTQNLLGTHPFRFLSANISPRRRQTAVVTPTTQIVDPVEEWICPRCEYSLFYSDGPEYKRAIRNRKKTLQRRRRAQERAAGGLSAPKTLSKAASNDGDDDDYDEFSARSPAISKSSEWKREGLDIKGTKERHHLQSG